MNKATQTVTQLQSLPLRLKESVGRRGWYGTLDLCAWKLGHFCAERLLPSRYHERRLDREFDARFGVDTSGIIQLDKLHLVGSNGAQGNEYEQSKPVEFYRLLRSTKAHYEDFVFVDLGSGKGRAVLLASELPFRRITGVEFAEELHRTAQENIRNYRSTTQKCRNIELFHLDAAEYQIPSEPAIFYLYNSFREEVMVKVLGNIQRSVAEQPRPVFLVYCNSVHRELVSQFGFTAVELGRWYAIYRLEKA
jgi:SAM-dependent methyltransferase